MNHTAEETNVVTAEETNIFPQVVLEYNSCSGNFSMKIDNGIPKLNLIGMLELLASMIIDQLKMEMAAKQPLAQSIILPEGPLPPPHERNR